jgi:phosphoglycolate phosphatase-like HAD superfamily hydrolase
MNRAYTTPKEFEQEREINLKAIDILKKHYNNYARRKNGMINNQDIDLKVFPKVKKDLGQLTAKQEQVIESTFDSFLGLLIMTGDSGTTFDILKKQAQGIYF